MSLANLVLQDIFRCWFKDEFVTGCDTLFLLRIIPPTAAKSTFFFQSWSMTSLIVTSFISSQEEEVEEENNYDGYQTGRRHLLNISPILSTRFTSSEVILMC